MIIKMLAEKLDENGITLADADSYNPMNRAIMSGKFENVQAMIGVYQEKKISLQLICTEPEEYTPEIVQLLLENGAIFIEEPESL